MPLSTAELILSAKKLEVTELQQLNDRVRLSGILGHLVHVLQSERGASSIYLASAGTRFKGQRNRLISESQQIAQLLLSEFEQALANPTFNNARISSLMAWVQVGLEAMPEFRASITGLKVSGDESLSAFSRMIAGLIALIFELADSAVDAEISQLLVSLFYLIDGKEMAGQERANGALAFAAGKCGNSLRQRVLNKIHAQNRSFRIFLDLADKQIKTRWQEMENSAHRAQLEELRQLIRETGDNNSLDPNLSDEWFGCASERISFLWRVQRTLVETLQQRCEVLISKARQELSDSTGLLNTLSQSASTAEGVVHRFFDPDIPVERLLMFRQGGADQISQTPKSVMDLLREQSRHLANVEAELESARQAIQERKLIERAKGILMTQLQVNEEQAYRQLRRMAMDNNRKLAEVAETVLRTGKAGTGRN